jgi:hypothetical protein
MDHREHLQYHTFDHDEEVYYVKHYEKILRHLFKIHPPIKLFTQNRFFLKFLKLPEARKVEEYSKFISNPNSDF